MEWRSTFPTTIYLLETRILVCFWAPQADFSPLRGALHVFCISKYIFTSKNPVKLDWSLYPVNLLCFFKYPVNLARLPPYPNQRGSMLFSCFLLDLTPMVKRSKSGPQNLEIVHFWVPFLDRILNVSRAKFGSFRVLKVRHKLTWVADGGPSGHLPCGCNLVI